MLRSCRFLSLMSAVVMLAGIAASALATPYASNVLKSGVAVSFTLNEPADSLQYSINGGAPVSIANTTKGTKTFNLNSATDTFSIVAKKNSATGFTIPTGTQIQPTDNGSLGIATNASGLNLISSDTDKSSWYGAPRGVGVSNNPNAANFGTVYISQGNTTGTLDPPNGPGARTMSDGLYALRADQSDAFGYGDTAQNPNTIPDGFPAFTTASSNSPYRISVAANGDVYLPDFADVNSNVFVLKQDLTSAQNLFAGYDGTSGTANPDGTSLPAGQNHGSSVAVATTGSLATNDLVVYTMDEDLTSNHVTGSGSTTDKYSLWKYTIGGGPIPVTTMPTKIADGFPASPTFVDMDRGADGKFYLSQNPGSTGSTIARLIVTDPSGTPVYNSLTASAALGSATDILLNLNQIAISPDQKWLAGMLNFSDVLVVPLINGIPDLANRLVVDAGNVNSGRDIAFDAADNIYYVSSGQQLFRILSPGGNTTSTLTWNGTTYSFATSTATGGVPGDYNGNGVVDMADYVLWRNGGPLQNEGASTGVVDSADYDFWRAHFGNHAGSGSGLGGSAVPEPCTAVLMFLAGTMGCLVRRRSGR